jgi:hypothetical protein
VENSVDYFLRFREKKCAFRLAKSGAYLFIRVSGLFSSTWQGCFLAENDLERDSNPTGVPQAFHNPS